MNNYKYKLCICYATYNRGDVFFHDISTLLVNNNDQRFCINIQDNKSTDGSYEKWEAIKDERLTIRQNKGNIGAIPNSMASLSHHPDAEYVMYCIDKDYVNPKYLSQFLDYLDKKEPFFGYIDIYNKDKGEPEIYTKGREAILKTSYLSRHPSGFFWKSELLENEFSEPYFKQLNPMFDFWFDLMTAHFAVKYDGVYLKIPVFIQNQYREEYKDGGAKSLTYNVDNLYFGMPKRLETYGVYLKDLFDLNLSITDKRYLAFKQTIRTISLLTFEYRSVYNNEVTCNHYGIKKRKVSYRELMHNTYKVLDAYSRIMKDKEPAIFVGAKSFFLYNAFALRLLHLIILRRI